MRSLHTAELLSVGTELTLGETRDTNSGDLARELTALGVEVLRISALPDDLPVVTDAFSRAMLRADLVISTGGLGPTPDDLTREAIAAACGVEPYEDGDLAAWLRDLFARRGLPMSETNRKQAWLIAGATALANPNGTAPGWWVDRADGRVIVALPGPPREMLPMWRGEVLERLRARDLGTERAAETLRLTGVGESALVDLVGHELFRASNPVVATYARADAVDLRISAVSEPAAERGRGTRPAREIVEQTLAALEARLAPYVFARGDETWLDALRQRMGHRRLAVVEIGTGGQLVALIGNAAFLAFGELLNTVDPADDTAEDLALHAERVREQTGADLGLAVSACERDGDTAVRVAIASPGGTTRCERTAFLGGAEGRRRAALLACAELWRSLAEARASA